MRVNSLFKHLTYRVFAPGTVLRKTYELFQELLSYDNQCHELMAELERYYYQGIKEDFCKISKTYRDFAENVEGMVNCLEQMAPTAYHDLPAYFHKFNFYAGFFIEPPALNISPPYVLHFQDTDVNAELAGTKTTKLIELGKALQLPVPDGFVITCNTFSYLLEYNNLQSRIDRLLQDITLTDLQALEIISKKLQNLIVNADVPDEIQQQIKDASATLQASTRAESFAVRSSAMAEDGECSFAGQYLSCLDIKIDEVVSSYKRILSSKYTPEALVYRISRGLYDTEAAMAVMVLPMIHPMVAGVIYTTDISRNNTNTLYIHATEGLGDKVVSGTVIPDLFVMDKNHYSIIEAKSGESSHRDKRLSEKQLAEMTRSAVTIENYYDEPQDIEWAINQSGKLLFLQTRGLRVPEDRINGISDFIPDVKSELLSGGECASSGIVTGIAVEPDLVASSTNMKQKSILVLQETKPSFVKLLPSVMGVIAGSGSSAGHFATVCREFEIPLLLGLGKEIDRVDLGSLITLHATDRKVYDGQQEFSTIPVPVYKREKNLPFFRRLRSLLDFVTPLKLVDPASVHFAPESCRSLHDIIRFCHEKAVATMFSVGDQAGRAEGVKKKLETNLPFDIFLVDIDHGIDAECVQQVSVSIDNITCTPFLPFWNGLTHPAIEWEDKTYYDWKSYDKMAMSDAFAFHSENDSASYAILGKHYLNVNMRFGYHFTVIDTLCEPNSDNNYCSLRFAGGGGEFEGRVLRLQFLLQVLEKLDFEVSIKGDLLDATLSHVSQKLLIPRLESLGRLLGLSKQMDMHLHDLDEVDTYVSHFFATA